MCFRVSHCCFFVRARESEFFFFLSRASSLINLTNQLSASRGKKAARAGSGACTRPFAKLLLYACRWTFNCERSIAGFALRVRRPPRKAPISGTAENTGVIDLFELRAWKFVRKECISIFKECEEWMKYQKYFSGVKKNSKLKYYYKRTNQIMICNSRNYQQWIAKLFVKIDLYVSITVCGMNTDFNCFEKMIFKIIRCIYFLFFIVSI